MGLLPADLPAYDDQQRGGFVGWTHVTDCVQEHHSSGSRKAAGALCCATAAPSSSSPGRASSTSSTSPRSCSQPQSVRLLMRIKRGPHHEHPLRTARHLRRREHPSGKVLHGILRPKPQTRRRSREQAGIARACLSPGVQQEPVVYGCGQAGCVYRSEEGSGGAGVESCELLTQKSRILDRLQTSRVDPCNQASDLPTLPAVDGK